jgi:hypothetical protein
MQGEGGHVKRCSAEASKAYSEAEAPWQNEWCLLDGTEQIRRDRKGDDRDLRDFRDGLK